MILQNNFFRNKCSNLQFTWVDECDKVKDPVFRHNMVTVSPMLATLNTYRCI